MKTKTCSRCNRELALSEFYNSSSSADGHGYYCKKCSSEYGRTWREKNLGGYELRCIICEFRKPLGGGYICSHCYNKYCPGGNCPDWVEDMYSYERKQRYKERRVNFEEFYIEDEYGEDWADIVSNEQRL